MQELNDFEETFLAKQEENQTPEDHKNKLIKVKHNWEFDGRNQEEVQIAKSIYSTTDKKLKD